MFLAFLFLPFLTLLSASSNVSYLTYGSVFDPFYSPLSSLSLYLSYPMISLNFSNSTNENGGFYFEFSYSPLPMLSGMLNISDPTQKYENMIVEVDNYVGTNFTCDLGVLVLSLKSLNVEFSGTVLNPDKTKGMKNVEVNVSYYLLNSTDNTSVYMGEITNTSNSSGGYSFQGVKLLSFANYSLNLSFGKRGYRAKRIVKVRTINSEEIYLGEDSLSYVLREGIVKGKLVFEGTSNGLSGVEIFFSKINDTSKNFSIISGDGGYFSTKIKYIREIHKLFYVLLTVYQKTIEIRLSRTLNYSCDLGEVAVSFRKIANITILGRLIESQSQQVLSNASLSLYINGSQSQKSKNLSNSSGEFELRASVEFLGPFYAEILVKKSGYHNKKVNLTGNLSDGLEINIGDIEIERKQEKENIYGEGVIRGVLWDKVLNMTGFMEVFKEMTGRITVEYDNKRKVVVVWNETVEISLKKLNLTREWYNITLKINLNDFKTSKYTLNLTKQSNFTSPFLRFNLTRKSKSFTTEFDLFYLNATQDYFQTPSQAQAKLTYFPLENSSNLTKTLFNVSLSLKNNENEETINALPTSMIFYHMRIFQGLEYSGILTVKSKFYKDTTKTFNFSLKITNSTKTSIFLIRKSLSPKISGLIRDIKTLLPVKNATILLSVFPAKSNGPGLERLIFSNKHGSFKVFINSNNSNKTMILLAGSQYDLRICFQRSNYRKLCRKSLLTWQNNYSLSFDTVFLSKKMVYLTLTGNIGYFSENFSVFVRINQKFNFKFSISGENGSFSLNSIEIRRNKSCQMELFVKETKEFQPLAYKAEIQPSKTNFSMDLGNLTILRKGIIINLVLKISNFSKSQNIMKSIEITEKTTNISVFTFKSLDSSNYLRKSLPISLYLNYSINITIISSFNKTFQNIKNLSCPIDSCHEDIEFSFNFEPITTVFSVCGSLTGEKNHKNTLFLDFETINTKNFIISTQKHIPIKNSTNFYIMAIFMNFEEFSEFYEGIITLKNKEFEKNELKLNFSLVNVKNRKNYENLNYRNCSLKENWVNLVQKRINVKINGFLSNFNNSVIYYIRLKMVNSGKNRIFKILNVLADGSYNFQRKLIEFSAYEVAIYQRNENNFIEILKKFGFFAKIAKNNNSSFEEIVDVKRNFSILANNSILLKIKGTIYDSKNNSNFIDNARINLNDESTIAISNNKGRFSILGYYSYDKNGSFAINVQKTYFNSKIKIVENCTNFSVFCEFEPKFNLKRKSANLSISANFSTNSLKIKNVTLEFHSQNNYSLIISNISNNLTIFPNNFAVNCSKCLPSGFKYLVTMFIFAEDPITFSNITKMTNFSITIGKNNIYKKSLDLSKILKLNKYVIINGFTVDNTTKNRSVVHNLFYNLGNLSKRVFIEPISGFFEIKIKSEKILENFGNLSFSIKNNKIYADIIINFTKIYFSDYNNITLSRRKINILINGYIYDYEDNKILENATISIFDNSNSDNISKMSDSNGKYNITLYTEAGLYRNLTFIVFLSNYSNYTKIFQKSKFSGNSVIFQDFFLKKSMRLINIWVEISTENSTNIQRTILEIFAFLTKIKKKTLILTRNVTVHLKLRVTSTQINIPLFIRSNDYYLSQSFNVTIDNETTQYNRTVILKVLDNSQKFEKAVIFGVFPIFSSFFYSCSMEISNSVKTKKNGSFSIKFLAYANQKYVCLLYFEGYNTPFSVQIDSDLGFSKDLGVLTPQKGLKIVSFLGKTDNFLKNQKGFLVFLRVYEENPYENITVANKSFNSINGSLMNNHFFFQIALKTKTLYRYDVEIRNNDLIVLNESKFLVKLPHKIEILGILIQNDSLKNFTVTLSNSSENDSFSGLMFTGISRKLLGAFNNSNFSFWNFSFTSSNIKIFIILTRQNFKDLMINITEGSLSYSLDVGMVLSNQIPLLQVYNEIIKISDDKNNTPISEKTIVNINNGSSFRVFSNSFGIYRLSIKIPIIKIPILVVLIQTKSYYPFSLTLNATNNNISSVTLTRKFIYGVFLTPLYDLFNFSKEISNLTISTISTTAQILISSTPNALNFSSYFPVNSIINLTLKIKSSHYKTLKATFVFIISDNDFEDSTVFPIFLTPKKILVIVTGKIKQYNQTIMNYSLISYNESPLSQKPKNGSLYTMNSSFTEKNLNISKFSIKIPLDPTESPFLLFLLFSNSKYQNYSILVILTYANHFSFKIPTINLKTLPTVNISVSAYFYDAQMTNILTPLSEVGVLLLLTEVDTQTIKFHKKYLENSTDGSFSEDIQIVSSEFQTAKTYHLTLFTKKTNFEPLNTTQNFIFSGSLSISLNFSSLFLSHIVTTAQVGGVLIDNLTLAYYLSGKTVYASFTCLNTEELQMVQINTDDNGMFNISIDVFQGFSYELVIELTIDDYQEYEKNYLLNVTNNYSMDLGYINMFRAVYNATISGVLKDSSTGMAIRNYGVIMFGGDYNITVITGSLGNFSFLFSVFMGFEYSLTMIYPLELNSSSNNSTNSTTAVYEERKSIRRLRNHRKSLIHREISLYDNLPIYPQNIVNVTLNKNNKYTKSLNELKCSRNNVTSLIKGQFSGNFSGIDTLKITINLTAGSVAYFFNENLNVTDDSSINFTLSEKVATSLNYSGSLMVNSEYLDLEVPVTFALNSEDNYSIDLGLISLTGTTVKFTLIGEVLDSSDSLAVVNASLYFLIELQNNDTLNFASQGVSDSTGNFSLTIKIPENLVINSSNYSQNDSGFSVLAFVRVVKLFYESVEINFTINSSEVTKSSKKLTYEIDLGQIFLTPDFILGIISGVLLDPITNQPLPDQSLSISIFQNNDSLVSISQLTTSSSGAFSLTSSLEKGFDYTVDIEISSLDSAIFDSFDQSFFLTVYNEYNLSNLLLYVIRKQGDLSLSAFIIDNSTRKPIENCLIVLSISFNRSSECVLTAENSSECGNFSILLDGVDFYDLNSSSNDELILKTTNFSDSAGVVAMKVRLWMGVSYNISLEFDKDPFIPSQSSKFISFNKDYTWSLGFFSLNRFKVTGVVFGWVMDSIFYMGLSNAQIYCKVTHSEIQDFSLGNETVSNENGGFSIEIYGLLAGLNFSLSVQTSRKYFTNSNETDLRLTYNSSNRDFNLPLNVSLVRKKCEFVISGTILSKLTNSTINNAKIQGNYTFLKENQSLTESSSDKNGDFSLKLSTFQGFHYNFSLQILPDTPYITKFLHFSAFFSNESKTKDFSVVTLKTQKIAGGVYGILMDSSDLSPIPNANVSLYYKDSTQNCSINESSCVLYVLRTNSSEDGSFSLSRTVFLGENYQLFLRIMAGLFLKKKVFDIAINGTNNYSLNVGNIHLNRLKVTAIINGSVIDSLTGKTIKKGYMSYSLRNFESNLTVVNEKNMNLSTDGAFLVNFTVFKGKNYLADLIFKRKYFNSLEKNITLNFDNNYTEKIENVSLVRSSTSLGLNIGVIDNLTSKGVPGARVALAIKPFLGNFSLRTEPNGTLIVSPMSVYEGLHYFLRFALTHKDFHKLSQKMNISIASPTTLNLSFVMFRKTVTFFVNGTVSDDSGNLLSSVTLTLNITLNSDSGIPALTFKTKSDDEGTFSFNGSMPAFKAINCTLKLKKTEFNTKKTHFQLKRSANFSKTLNITMSPETSSQSGTIGLTVSNQSELIQFQLVTFSCGLKLKYIPNAAIVLRENGKVLNTTNSDFEGMVSIGAPLVFYGKSQEPASYVAEVAVDKEGYFEKVLEVTVGGADWISGVNLGQVEIIAEVC